MIMKKRERIVLIAGAVLLVAGVVGGRERPALELIEARTPAAAAVAAADDGIDLTKLDRTEGTLPQADPFKSFVQPAPQAAAHAAPAKPAAPPLPFRYFGKLLENGKREVFVMRGDDLLSIQAGKTYGDYRVDQVADARITFTYLPLQTKQTLDLQ
jgi:hypothetical protein